MVPPLPTAFSAIWFSLRVEVYGAERVAGSQNSVYGGFQRGSSVANQVTVAKDRPQTFRRFLPYGTPCAAAAAWRGGIRAPRRRRVSGRWPTASPRPASTRGDRPAAGMCCAPAVWAAGSVGEAWPLAVAFR